MSEISMLFPEVKRGKDLGRVSRCLTENFLCSTLRHYPEINQGRRKEDGVGKLAESCRRHAESQPLQPARQKDISNGVSLTREIHPRKTQTLPIMEIRWRTMYGKLSL